jgi:hypothetical protein
MLDMSSPGYYRFTDPMRVPAGNVVNASAQSTPPPGLPEFDMGPGRWFGVNGANYHAPTGLSSLVQPPAATVASPNAARPFGGLARLMYMLHGGDPSGFEAFRQRRLSMHQGVNP